MRRRHRAPPLGCLASALHRHTVAAADLHVTVSRRASMGALCRTLRAALCIVVCSAASTSLAQSDTQEACPGFVATRTPRVIPAALARGEVSLTFVGHATFLIESPGGVRVATDYNDYVRPPVVPDVA